MKSGKQRRQEIRARRRQRAERAEKVAQVQAMPVWFQPTDSVAVNPGKLAPYNSYGAPQFVLRGWYEDQRFRCQDCGAEQVWTAAQQQWWYEIAKGYVYSTAIRCRPCRQARRSAKQSMNGQRTGQTANSAQ